MVVTRRGEASQAMVMFRHSLFSAILAPALAGLGGAVVLSATVTPGQLSLIHLLAFLLSTFGIAATLVLRVKRRTGPILVVLLVAASLAVPVEASNLSLAATVLLGWSIASLCFLRGPLQVAFRPGIRSAGGVSPEGSKGREALRSLANAAELRDHHTHGHCQRVAYNAERIGAFMGFTEAEMFDLRWAALLHDLGKLGVSTGVLVKPGSLTADEFEQVKLHSQVGADLVASASADLGEISRLVLAHHERWDGHGYPRGFGGQTIPLGSRIIAVADVFEALTSARPYRAAVSESEAVQVIIAGAGTHFDPDVVTVFKGLFDSGQLSNSARQGAASAMASAAYACLSDQHSQAPTLFAR